MPDPDPEASRGSADELYGLGPEEFVAGRDALAKRLQAAGQTADAAAVKKLRRPSASAWALNQVARTDGGVIDSALDAGDRLRVAMRRVVGGETVSWKEVQAEERDAVDHVVAAASRLLERRDTRVTEALARRIAASVRAAISESDIADQLRRGVLPDDVESTGLGLDIVPIPVHGAPARRHTADDAAMQEEECRQREQRARRAKLDADAARLRQRADRLAAAAADAEERAQTARTDADDAAAAARAAEEQASGA